MGGSVGVWVGNAVDILPGSIVNGTKRNEARVQEIKVIETRQMYQLGRRLPFLSGQTNQASNLQVGDNVYGQAKSPVGYLAASQVEAALIVINTPVTFWAATASWYCHYILVSQSISVRYTIEYIYWIYLKRYKMHGKHILRLVFYGIQSPQKIVPDMFGPCPNTTWRPPWCLCDVILAPRDCNITSASPYDVTG